MKKPAAAGFFVSNEGALAKINGPGANDLDAAPRNHIHGDRYLLSIWSPLALPQRVLRFGVRHMARVLNLCQQSASLLPGTAVESLDDKS